jgi:hypothetical protein
LRFATVTTATVGRECGLRRRQQQEEEEEKKKKKKTEKGGGGMLPTRWQALQQLTVLRMWNRLPLAVWSL